MAMTRNKAFLVFLLLLISAGTSWAQEKPDLFERIQRVFQEQEPSWKIDQVYPTSTTDPLTLDVALRRGKQRRASVNIAVWRRKKDAQGAFEGICIALDNSRRKALKSSVPHLGDENHMWVDQRNRRWPLIQFIKGSTIVGVFAPTVPIALRFARHVLKELPPN